MNTINQYPCGDSRVPTRRLIVAGKYGQKLRQIKEQADRKREAFKSDVTGSPSETIDYDHYGAVMAERRKREAEQL